MKQTILFILLCITLSCYANENNEIESQTINSMRKHSNFIVGGLGSAKDLSDDLHISSRLRIGLLKNNISYSIDFEDYSDLRFGPASFRKGELLDQFNINMIICRNTLQVKKESGSYFALGSGLSYIHRTVRDEHIMYEDWTSKSENYIGLPLNFELTVFSERTHLCFTMNYRFVIYRNGTYQNFTIEFGFWKSG